MLYQQVIIPCQSTAMPINDNFILIIILLIRVTSCEICPRPYVGDWVRQHENLFSFEGYLDIHATYVSRSHNNKILYCYTDQFNNQSPTLRVYPGETILFTLTNNVVGTKLETLCANTTLTSSSTNVHFHGVHSPPDYHVDESIKTIINYQEVFTYDLEIPTMSQSPGIYWYHPHVHGLTENALLGGASGAIVIEGIENIQPLVEGLPEQIFVLRDLATTESGRDGSLEPRADISVNYVPVKYPEYTPAKVVLKPEQKQLWRIVNACADAMLHLQLHYDGIPQSMIVVAVDGVITGSNQDVKSYTRKSLLIVPAGRVEVIIITPSVSVSSATLVTLDVDTGPHGERDPLRPLMDIKVDVDAPKAEVYIPMATANIRGKRIPKDLLNAKPVKTRKFVFSEDMNQDHNDMIFFITLDEWIRFSYLT
jgi:FtsP/CotA-like multicopper oxidase with cupredoxin domain